MRRDYYAVLGVSVTAAPREIRRAYQRLARQYSPDVNFWDRDARQLFDEIEQAYRVLSDPAARAMYDRFGNQTPGVLESGRRGEDLHASVEVAFADAARGVSLDLGVPRFSPCAACGASGTSDGALCAHCLGRGVRRAVETVTVDVPAGVDSGSEIRVRGQGHAGPFGGPRGDLIVSTRVAEHPFFRRKGDAVHCDVSISVWEALTGARIRIPTPTGESVLVIPPGIGHDRVVRLRGQGMPRLSGGQGDLFVTVRVELPSGIDARTQELVCDLARLLPIDVRAGLERYRGGAA
jgi:DnaJ-class molecular chaperone